MEPTRWAAPWPEVPWKYDADAWGVQAFALDQGLLPGACLPQRRSSLPSPFSSSSGRDHPLRSVARCRCAKKAPALLHARPALLHPRRCRSTPSTGWARGRPTSQQTAPVQLPCSNDLGVCPNLTRLEIGHDFKKVSRWLSSSCSGYKCSPSLIFPSLVIVPVAGFTPPPIMLPTTPTGARLALNHSKSFVIRRRKRAVRVCGARASVCASVRECAVRMRVCASVRCVCEHHNRADAVRLRLLPVSLRRCTLYRALYVVCIGVPVRTRNVKCYGCSAPRALHLYRYDRVRDSLTSQAVYVTAIATAVQATTSTLHYH